MGTTALLTDHYELTMLDAARTSGAADHRAVFEVFARSLPAGRRFGVVGGTGRLADAIARFRFGDAELDELRAKRVVGAATIDWLARYRFTGDVVGYAEGDTYFPNSPVVRVEGTFAETVVLETLVLSILNHDTAIASAAARMAVAAEPGGARLIEMGGRRTHEAAAVDAARIAYIAGFHASSNLEAGRRYGVPTTGTAAHAFTLAHRDEHEAFVAQLHALGVGTTLLVDTFDTEEGIRTAVKAARELGATGPGAIRIDSGNLPDEARRARVMLDELGAPETRIVVSGDLDEFRIDELERTAGGRPPIDAYGVGTSVVTGSGHATAGFVYKLVAVADEPGADSPLRPVAKLSAGKATHGHRKVAYRVRDRDGRAVAELLSVGAPPPSHARPLHVPIVSRGEAAPAPTIDGARAHHLDARRELPDGALALQHGAPVLMPELFEGGA